MTSSSTVRNNWIVIAADCCLHVMLDLNTLNDLTPKVKCGPRGIVDPKIIFGLDSKQFILRDECLEKADVNHHDEVQTVTVHRGSAPLHVHGEKCNHDHTPNGFDHQDQVDASPVDPDVLKAALAALSKESVWRVKGFLALPSGLHILNWAFGRYKLTKVSLDSADNRVDGPVQLTVMGEQGEVKRHARRLASALGAGIS